MTLGELFSKDVVKAETTDSIADVAERMANCHVGAVVIVKAEVPVGIVTDRDIAIGLGTGGASKDDPIGKIMTAPVATIGHRKHVLAATKVFRETCARRLPIVDDRERLVGMVSVDDLLILLGREIYNVTQSIVPEVSAARPVSQFV